MSMLRLYRAMMSVGRIIVMCVLAGLLQVNSLGAQAAAQNWEALLSRHVKEGMVEFDRLSRHQPELLAYINELCAQPPTDDWSQTEQVVYWCNLYNAGALALLLENYPLRSLQPLRQAGAYNQQRLRVGEQTFSLQQVADRLARQFRNPKVLFAINPGARSFASMRSRLWRADTFDTEIEQHISQYLQRPRSLRVQGDAVELPEWFQWYPDVFDKNPLVFVGRYVKLPKGATVGGYLPADWRLCGQ